ncbi:MAG: 30S ribosome-binding factor RbfA [Oscillospiraceae bacterium]|nr:30S ribosome-binding factor RbfA [Oscillospiraceae bacterium]
MANYKVNRMTEDIRRELTDIMHMMKDPRISSLLTIMKVDLSNDYGHCRVYISSMEGIEKANEAVKGLNSGAGFIRREINSRLKMRRTPEFKFIADDSTEYSAGIAKILNDLEVGKNDED